MAVQAEFRWLSSLEANESCKQDLDFFNSDCNSYVRLVLPHNDSYYLVCASSAKMPACRPLTLTQVSVTAILLLPNWLISSLPPPCGQRKGGHKSKCLKTGIN